MASSKLKATVRISLKEIEKKLGIKINKSEIIKITLKETSKKKAKQTFVFPSLPERIQVQSNTRYQTYDIINTGTIQIPSGTDTDTISWSGIFFGEILKKQKIIQKWMKPKECEKILKNWMDKKMVLNLIVSKTSINYDVTISSFERVQTGAYGNIEYSISFTRYRPLKVYDASELDLKPYEVKERPAPPSAQTYTVVSGDNLWKISTRFYGAGTRWPEIYGANSESIEATARSYGKSGSDNGHWIYPGQVLVIP